MQRTGVSHLCIQDHRKSPPREGAAKVAQWAAVQSGDWLIVNLFWASFPDSATALFLSCSCLEFSWSDHFLVCNHLTCYVCVCALGPRDGNLTSPCSCLGNTLEKERWQGVCSCPEISEKRMGSLEAAGGEEGRTLLI